jgi:4-amino-4-deoxy-L-arabinose transferase-like glycosyltransferase
MNFEKFRKVANKKTFRILFAIFFVGIFLRTYNFHDWMRFEGDQSRDAAVADNVLSGKAVWPLLGPHMNHTTFKLGAIYYYFQIISAKIFGNTPESVAYPDLLFSILSIPLLFFFLKRYFSENLSLSITGLYSFSFFAIKYSRFAWNINPIPFFVILFLLALLEFLLNKEKTRWIWIASLGIAIGVGYQLHAILLFLLPTTTLVVFLIIMKGKWASKNLWLKWATVVVVFLVLNTGQIISEMKNNFNNSRTLVRLVYHQIFETPNTMITDFKEAAVCHIETNTLMLTSYGDQENCDFSYSKLFSDKAGKYLKIIMKNQTETVIFMLGLIFSVFGYGSMYYHFKKEKDREKKYFLGLVLLYSGISFFILMMVGNLLRPRYFIHTVFIPLMFVGFLLMYLSKRFPGRKNWITFLTVLIILIANLISIYAETKELVEKRRSEARYVVLGEAEAIIDYISSKSENKNEIYISGSPGYIWEFYNPLRYIASKKGIKLIQTEHRNEFPPNRPVFYITPKIKDSSTISGRPIEDLKIFGQVAVYKLGI